MPILDYRELATFLGSAVPANGPYVGIAVLQCVQDPTFPAVEYTPCRYGWDSTTVLTWTETAQPRRRGEVR